MKSKLVLLLAAAAIIAASLTGLRSYWSLEPFTSYKDYSNISRAFSDADGTYYVITDSKKTIRKVTEKGKLVYEYSSENVLLPDTVPLFDSITADEAGNAYALVTDLDTYALRVVGERIVKLADDGAAATVLYEQSYAPDSSLFRVGKLQSLSVKGDRLYFLDKEADSAKLLSVSKDAPGQDGVIVEKEISISNNRYLNEIVGNASGQLIFTTKRGFLYAYQAEGERLVYPQSNEVVLNFPLSIVSDGGQYVYFIDYHDRQIKRSSISTGAVSEWLSLEQLARFDDGVEWEEFASIALHADAMTIVASDRLLRVDAGGKIVHMQAGYSFPIMTLVKRIFYWVLLLLLVAVAIAFARFCYVHVMKRKIFLLLKQLAVILPVVLISMAALSYSVYQSFSSEMKDDTFQQLRLLAGNGKYLVGTEHLERLNSPRDFGSDDYNLIKMRLNEMFAHTGEHRDGLYNSIYRYLDGELYLIMDDDNSVAMFQPFPLSEDNLRVLEHGETIQGMWQDASGEWLFAIGPLYNSSGEIIGIFETGKDMAYLQQSKMEILSNVMMIFVLVGIALLIVITLMTFYLLSSIRKLRRNVNLIASGEWDVKVDIRTRDEVEELGERFNMMASSIRQYLQEVTKLSNSYFRFVPEQFLQVLGKTNMTQIRLGEQQNRQAAILVCNMRDFEQFSIRLSTEENFSFINSFLKRFGPVIREHGGFISRYLGPGMLTMFPNDVGSALKAAIQLRKSLELYNEQRSYSGYDPIDISIAVHYGDVMLGIIGEEQRIEGSVVSSHVTRALELDKLAGKLGANILLTREALEALPHRRPGSLRKLGAIEVSGEQEPIELYDLYEGDTKQVKKLKQETQREFEQSVELFRNGKFYDAREGFVSVVKRNRYDLAAKLYFFESDRYYQEGAAANWNHAMKVV